MRKFLQFAYTGLLRGQGGYTILLALVFFSNIPAELERGHYVVAPSVMMGVMLAISLVLVVPRLTPGWLLYLQKGLVSVGVLALLAFLQVLFLLAGVAAVAVTGLSDELAKSIVVLVSVPSILFCGGAWWAGLALSIWPDPGVAGPGPTRPARKAAPEPEPTPAPQRVDARELRLSRMNQNA